MEVKSLKTTSNEGFKNGVFELQYRSQLQRREEGRGGGGKNLEKRSITHVDRGHVICCV